MVSQESQMYSDVNIYFVVANKYSSENDCTDEMWEAYNTCREASLQPMWINESNCDTVKLQKNDVFIIEEFKGELFNKLKNFKCSIIGPRCLVFCLTNLEPVPEGNSPIFSTAMKGLCICASGLSPDTKDRIQELVEYMGGFFTRQLRSCVTHLVTESVMSAKYESAVEMKISIVTKEWVEAVWKANLNKFVAANDSIFDKYKCPVFLNLIVTSTNLPRWQKEEIKRLINEHGGTFMGPLDGSKVRIVLAPETGPLSDKLKYAMQTNIACMKPDWVYQSIQNGYALPFSNFLIKSTKACSTPEKSQAHETLNCSAISSIQCDLQSNNYVDESMLTTITSFSTTDLAQSNVPTARYVTVLDRLTFAKAKLAGPFLDGCNIYLAGFTSNQRDKLNRILNVGSATRLDDISDALTHVIVGDENKASTELKFLKNKGLCPYLLNLEWLEESIKLKRAACEEDFRYEQKSEVQQKSSEPQSPLSKKNLQMLQQPKRPSIPVFDINKKLTSVKEHTEPDLVQQYLQETAESDRMIHDILQPYKSVIEKDHKKEMVEDKESKIKKCNSLAQLEVPESKNPADDSAVPISQTPTINDKLFEGLTFVVTGFSEEDGYVAETISALGGHVVPNIFTGIPDYGVVPKCGAPLKHTVNEIVTDLFIEDCINQEQIVEIAYYHRPLSITKHSNPLAGCVISMSMYTGVERLYLSTMATQMGAICQDIFARKTNVEKNTYGSTHLVCPTPEGSKYNAAVKWKRPAVTAEWLKSCAAQLKLVDETPFLVGETTGIGASEKPCLSFETDKHSHKTVASDMGPPTTEATSRNVLTPKRHLPVLKKAEVGTSETPIINKRLSLVITKTPQSPFHVSTPETPYGQVFKENPSPDTRKGWIKWVDNFPDLRVEEPPLKRRAPSTPLSELKRQLWQKIKTGETDNGGCTAENKELPPRSPVEIKDVDSPNEEEKSSPAPINRKLDFNSSPMHNNEINLQIAQLDQVLQRTCSTPENRYSLSGENPDKYMNEPADEIQKCIVKDSQPVDVIVWEDPSHPKQKQSNSEVDKELETEKQAEEKVAIKPPKKPKFMLSCIKDRAPYERVIRDLGAEVSADVGFDPTATHLLCIRPTRNEKMLGSIASGKWVLHCSYLRHSELENKFLDEEKYEWGNPKSKGFIPEPSGETENAIAAAAYRWRCKLLRAPLQKPFQDMVALLLVAKEKYPQFQGLIEAGGGQVVEARPPYDTSPSGKKITHCFVNVKQVGQPIDWAMLASKGILCFLPQYLSDHLTAESPLKPRERVLPEFKKYLTLLPK
ncbi:hypothetical protein KM043_004733 [Ampulex compressa]|nr:hypothetical protein KM043_004733 [Ampulex compressa]